MTTLVPNASQRRSLERATSRYQQDVLRAADYLSKRGLTEEIAEEARLGFVAEPEPGHESFVGRLSIPYLAVSGVVQLRFRCLQDHDCKTEGCPKYLYETGAHPRLYNAPVVLQKTPVIAICEGEIDALSVHHLAGVPAVGVPGVASWEPFWNRLFTGYDTILVIADGDEPGMDFARSIVEGSSRRRIAPLDNARIVKMPDKEDANSFIVSEGVDAFRERLGIG